MKTKLTSNIQHPTSREDPSPKLRNEPRLERSEFGSWIFPGAWILDLGCSTRTSRNTERGARTSRSSGIALVITLILLAIITFLAITLLVVTRSEKGTVGVKADQTTAALAADIALERSKMHVLAPMLA